MRVNPMHMTYEGRNNTEEGMNEGRVPRKEGGKDDYQGRKEG
jgi:hypothetical protein